MKQFVQQFLLRFPVEKPHDRVISISYSSALRWIRKLGDLLGANHLGLTTHSFRRSGASELARQGMPLSDILLYGRWLSERAARDYIRKGEVAIFRARQLLQPIDSRRISAWSNLGVACWSWFDVFYKHGHIQVDVKKLSVDKLSKVEEILFSVDLTVEREEWEKHG